MSLAKRAHSTIPKCAQRLVARPGVHWAPEIGREPIAPARVWGPRFGRPLARQIGTGYRASLRFASRGILRKLRPRQQARFLPVQGQCLLGDLELHCSAAKQAFEFANPFLQPADLGCGNHSLIGPYSFLASEDQARGEPMETGNIADRHARSVDRRCRPTLVMTSTSKTSRTYDANTVSIAKSGKKGSFHEDTV
jgi:hypothetical protein